MFTTDESAASSTDARIASHRRPPLRAPLAPGVRDAPAALAAAPLGDPHPVPAPVRDDLGLPAFHRLCPRPRHCPAAPQRHPRRPRRGGRGTAADLRGPATPP